MQVFAGTDRGLWLVQQRQSELMHEAAQDRLARFVPEPERQTRPARAFRFGDLFAAIAFGQSQQLTTVRHIVAPEPCPDCADCSC